MSYDLEESDSDLITFCDNVTKGNSAPITNIFEWLDQTAFIMLTKISMTVLNVEGDAVTSVTKVLYWEKCLLEKCHRVGLEK